MHKYIIFPLFALVSLGAFAACQQQPVSTGEVPESETSTTNSEDQTVSTIGELTIGEPDEHMNGEMVEYGEDFSGYLVQPLEEGEYPGVVMIHEWWGLNQNIKNMAHDLAAEGYNVLAVDLYDGQVAAVPDDARTYATEVRESPERAIEHMRAAAEYLRGMETYGGTIASMGWCFGGQQSLQLALNDELDATVIYYGNLVTDQDELSSIDWPVLGVFGEEDTSIPVETVNEFESALTALGVENEIHIYEGVGHAFANPSNDGHDPEKTVDAWEKTVDFLSQNL